MCPAIRSGCIGQPHLLQPTLYETVVCKSMRLLTPRQCSEYYRDHSGDFATNRFHPAPAWARGGGGGAGVATLAAQIKYNLGNRPPKTSWCPAGCGNDAIVATWPRAHVPRALTAACRVSTDHGSCGAVLGRPWPGRVDDPNPHPSNFCVFQDSFTAM